MTHKDKGKYFEKHARNTKVDDDLKREIMGQAKENNIACKSAEKVAARKSITISEIGKTIDILNINIVECQLGLFGYGEVKKIVKPLKDVIPELKENITSRLNDGRLPCAAAWEIAGKLNIPRMRVCAACEAMQIKIKPCQLGAF
jgi:hypothetical protein